MPLRFGLILATSPLLSIMQRVSSKYLISFKQVNLIITDGYEFENYIPISNLILFIFILIL